MGEVGVMAQGSVRIRSGAGRRAGAQLLTMEDKVIPLKDLESLLEWGKIWGLKFNVFKCSILHLAMQVTKPVRFYTLGGEVISSISEAKYLGVTLSNNYGTRSSQWKPHILDTVSRANQHLGYLRRNLQGSPYKLRETAYLTWIRPSLEYCGAIWEPSCKEGIESLEVIQRKAAIAPEEPMGLFRLLPFWETSAG